jgi:hypothetical protein
MNVAHPERSPKYDKRDIGRIIRLARTAAPDQPRVQQIDFASAQQAEVRTGQRQPDDDKSPDHGQMLYVRKAGGVWKVTGRAEWIYAGNGGLFEVKPQRPNRAMQRTAGRSAFKLSTTSTFNQQPYAPSPAVADLGSR